MHYLEIVGYSGIFAFGGATECPINKMNDIEKIIQNTPTLIIIFLVVAAIWGFIKMVRSRKFEGAPQLEYSLGALLFIFVILLIAFKIG